MMSVGVKFLLEIIPGSSMRIHKPGPGDIERRWGTNAIGLPEIHHEGFKTRMQYSEGNFDSVESEYSNIR